MTIPGEWTVHGERSIYDSEWMSLRLVDVETPSGKRFSHHVTRIPVEAAATLIVVERRVLMIWRHRFVTDTWCWELPAGRIDPDETVAQAAARECLEETGWQPGRSILGIHLLVHGSPPPAAAASPLGATAPFLPFGLLGGLLPFEFLPFEDFGLEPLVSAFASVAELAGAFAAQIHRSSSSGTSKTDSAFS